MYNRYIPQPDGTYRRNRIPDSDSHPKLPVSTPQENTCPQKEPPPIKDAQQDSCHSESTKQESRDRERPTPSPCPRSRQNGRKPFYDSPRQNHQHEKQDPCNQHDNSVGSFLRQLLPKDFETSDLLIVLLLLLMAGDCAEDKNNALLTLALYLFM